MPTPELELKVLTLASKASKNQTFTVADLFNQWVDEGMIRDNLPGKILGYCLFITSVVGFDEPVNGSHNCSGYKLIHVGNARYRWQRY